MSYPAIDDDTVAAYELSEPGSDHHFYGEGQTTLQGLDLYPGPYLGHNHYGSWSAFLDSVEGGLDAFLYDTAPSSATTFAFDIPAIFNPPRAIAFRQGTATGSRSYLVLPVPTLPPALLTVSMWIQPFQGTGAVWEILHKEYFGATPTDGVVAGTWASPFYGGMQFYALSTSGGQWGASINIAGTVHSVSITGNSFERYFLRYGQWNHIGATYDGAVFCIYINGQLAATTALSGNIDYGAGAWVCGCTRDGGGTLYQMNAAVKRIRFEQVAKPASYFFDAYTSASGGGAGDLAVLNMAPSLFDDDPVVAKHTPITFTVRGSSHVLVALRYEESHDRVIVYDDGFQPGFQVTSSAIVDEDEDNDIDFTVLPNGGWQDSIGCFSVIAVSDTGEAINFGDE